MNNGHDLNKLVDEQSKLGLSSSGFGLNKDLSNRSLVKRSPTGVMMILSVVTVVLILWLAQNIFTVLSPQVSSGKEISPNILNEGLNRVIIVPTLGVGEAVYNQSTQLAAIGVTESGLIKILKSFINWLIDLFRWFRDWLTRMWGGVVDNWRRFFGWSHDDGRENVDDKLNRNTTDNVSGLPSLSSEDQHKILVLPDGASTTKGIKQKVEGLFSDPVSVEIEGGTTGLIRPEFKTGEQVEYRFILESLISDN